MSESVNLPALGESVTEGTVTRWLKKVGDRVDVDEPLVEVSTDKVDTEIPSPIAGVLEAILVAEDETVDVGTPLATIGGGAPDAPAQDSPAAEAAPPAQAEPAPDEPAPAEPATATEAPAEFQAPPAAAPVQESPEEAPAPAPVAEEAPAPAPAAAPTQAPAPVAPPAPPAPAPAPAAAAPAPDPAASAPAPAPTAAPAPVPAPVPAPAPAPSPAVSPPAPPATAAANAGYVTPLVRKLANESGIDLSTISGSGIGGRIRKQDVLSATGIASGGASARKPLETSPLRGTTVPMSRLRKVVAERAVVSMQTSAQLTTVVEVDVTAVSTFRDSVKAAFLEKTGNKLTFLPFFTLAAAEALKAFPIINASIDGESIVYPGQENVSIAVDTERGLLTPVIRNAGDLNLAQLAGQIADLADRTRNNQLKPDELAGGTFTVTNTGSRGALFDTPVVFLPQSAILGTGIVTKRPVVVTDNGLDAIAIRSMAYLALSYDHRIVDGADAARFLVAVKERLEQGDFAGVLGLN